MSAAKRPGIEDLLLKDDPKELVYFRIGKKPLIKIHKSVLIENSSVFKDMFAEGVTNDDPMKPIPITDRTSMPTHQVFLLFARCLYEMKDASSLIGYRKSVNKIKHDFIFPFEDVYVFADKYHVQWLIEVCRRVAIQGLSYIMKKHSLWRTLKRGFKMIQKMELEEQLMSTFKRAKINFNRPDVVVMFKTCQEMGVDELTNQVVDFCCNMKFDPSWPAELSDMVMERLKNHVSRGKRLGVLTFKQHQQLVKVIIDNL